MHKARGCNCRVQSVKYDNDLLLHAMSSDSFQNASKLYEHLERSFNPWGDLADHILLKVNFSL